MAASVNLDVQRRSVAHRWNTGSFPTYGTEPVPYVWNGILFHVVDRSLIQNGPSSPDKNHQKWWGAKRPTIFD